MGLRIERRMESAKQKDQSNKLWYIQTCLETILTKKELAYFARLNEFAYHWDNADINWNCKSDCITFMFNESVGMPVGQLPALDYSFISENTDLIAKNAEERRYHTRMRYSYSLCRQSMLNVHTSLQSVPQLLISIVWTISVKRPYFRATCSTIIDMHVESS